MAGYYFEIERHYLKINEQKTNGPEEFFSEDYKWKQNNRYTSGC